jgi:hypothetical protein
VQLKDQLVVHLLDGMTGYAYPGRGRASSWVGSVPVDAPSDAADRWKIAQEQFEALDLKQINELKKKYPRAEPANSAAIRSTGTTTFVAKNGSIFVGAFVMRDPRSNTVADIAFKILVEKLASDGGPAEDP